MTGLIYLPLLIFHLNLPQTSSYNWAKNELIFVASLNLHENKDDDSWALIDESFEFLFFCERVLVADCEPELLQNSTKKSAFALAKLYNYEKVRDGGKMPNVDDGYYVIATDEGEEHYVLLIKDKSKACVYEIYIESTSVGRSFAYEIINSLQFI